MREGRWCSLRFLGKAGVCWWEFMVLGMRAMLDMEMTFYNPSLCIYFYIHLSCGLYLTSWNSEIESTVPILLLRMLSYFCISKLLE